MNLTHFTGSVLDVDAPFVALPLSKGAQPDFSVLPGEVATAVSLALQGGDLTGKLADEIVCYAAGDGTPGRWAFLGTGPEENFDLEGVRSFAGRAVRVAERISVTEIALVLPAVDSADGEAVARAAAEGAALAAWRFRELKTPNEEDSEPPEVSRMTLVVDTEAAADGSVERGIRLGSAAANGQNLARTLQSRPGNVATPTHLAEAAEAMAGRTGLEVTILGPTEIAGERMHALLAVAQGSSQEPRFIVLRHRGGVEGAAPLVLVGKGLTFDAGGISLKPPAGMEDMKYDMSGGAAVIGAMAAVAEAGLAINVVGLVPSSENLPSGTAVKPGDVIRSRAGKSIEVINTDAEGRLILADALSYARDLEPAAVVDCATLTGACVVALGHHASAVLGTDEALVEELREAGMRSGERCWPLPLWPEYRKQLDSDVADLKNVGGRPGGAVTAACFLQEFVGDVPWAHLDVAGTAYGEGQAYQRKGALGTPARLLFEWVRSRST